MLYTFTVTETGLDQITDYLDRQWQYPDRLDRYIWSVQRSLQEDRVFITVECDEATAVFLTLMVDQ